MSSSLASLSSATPTGSQPATPNAATPTLSQEEEDAAEDEMDEEEEEDTELRDLVTNVLTANGVLGKIKAQLRANVYLALEDGGGQAHKPPPPHANAALSDFLSTSDGRLVLHLVREFLSFFDLRHTLSVLDPEAGVASSSPGGVASTPGGVAAKDRAQLMEDLGLMSCEERGRTTGGGAGANRRPLLAEIVRLSKVSVLKSETPTPTATPTNDRTDDDTSAPSSLETTHKSSSGAFKRETDEPSDSVPVQSPYTPSVASASATHVVSPMNNVKSTAKEEAKLDGTFTLNKDKDKPFSQTATRTLSPAKVSTPTPAPAPSNSSLGDLPRLSGQSSLGNLPPLSGSPQSGKKLQLAPLKKPPPSFGVAGGASGDGKKMELKACEVASKEAPAAVGDPFKKPAVNPSPTQSAKPDSSSPRDESVEEDIVDEDLEDFLNSSGISASEDFTKDETASEVHSLKADYVEKL